MSEGRVVFLWSRLESPGIEWKFDRSIGARNNLLGFVRARMPAREKTRTLIQLNGLAGTVKVAPRSQLLPLRPAADPCTQDVLEVCVDSPFLFSIFQIDFQ